MSAAPSGAVSDGVPAQGIHASSPEREGFKRFDRELSRPRQALFRVRLYDSKVANEG
jgi:hypothetical protein